MPSKLKSYDDATKKLVLAAMDYDVLQTSKFSLPEMVFLLRESFKYKRTYSKVFNEILRQQCDPSTGFCLVSSYFIYERTGGNKVWTLMKKSPLHWWLVHKQTGKVFDVTYTQFSEPFPYHLGMPENKLKTDKDFVKMLQGKALILGKQAGLE